MADDNASIFSRRHFLAALCAATAGGILPCDLHAVSGSRKLNLACLVYPGGNWQPRPTALRRLAWELHKRTAIDTLLEPTSVTPTPAALARTPLIFLCGDRPFPTPAADHIATLSRFLKLGGTIIIDPAYTVDGDPKGFTRSALQLMKKILPGTNETPIEADHVIFRSFYRLTRAVGRVKGTDGLSGFAIGARMAIIRTDHDLSGAYARDNLGNWEFPVEPGGDRQRENAFRLGVNLAMYALCQDYKNEQPHRRFSEDPPR